MTIGFYSTISRYSQRHTVPRMLSGLRYLSDELGGA